MRSATARATANSAPCADVAPAAPVREDRAVHDLTNFVEGFWWLIFVIPPVLGGTLQQHHRRRLAILAAKGKLAETKNQAPITPPELQPICGCSHHLSFHNPRTSACAVDDCRCQQYVGPEPLGYVFAQPLVDPEAAQLEGDVSAPSSRMTSAE
jgi:hypothetical protein